MTPGFWPEWLELQFLCPEMKKGWEKDQACES